jgi:hypothetical protein
MKKSFPNILILGSRYDFTCDYVVAQLRKLGTLYLRLNSEDLGAQEVVLEPKQGTLNVLIDNAHYCLNQGSLKSIYYRRPVFLREYDSTKHDPIEQFQRYQWAAFMRNLMLFNECLWVNHPTATYYAEHKAVQLHTAFKIGFDVPDTLITNQFSSLDTKVIRDGKVTIKGLDTVLVRNKGTETFGFANIVSLDNTTDDVINSAPPYFKCRC